jgi:hypothetical protein
MSRLLGDDPPDAEPIRASWHGLNQARPRLPYYFRRTERLKSLDEFEAPPWKGRVRFNNGKDVTVRGVARETLLWLIVFVVVGLIVGAFWEWLRS